MRKIFIALLSVILCFAVVLPFAGCSPKQNNKVDSEDVTAEGIDKEDVYTWFDVNKSDLPNLSACLEIKEGMSLNQVIKILGKPQRSIAVDSFLFQFDLNYGSVLTITFVEKSEKKESNPKLTTYDCLVVSTLDFEQGVPAVYFPYEGFLNDLYPWIDELNVEEIVKVRYEQSFTSVAPGNLKYISYSTDSVDIQGAYRLLFSPLKAITEEESHIAGGRCVQYDFYTTDNVFSITVGTNMVTINGQHYQFVDAFYYEFQNPDRDCYSFFTYDMPSYEEYEIYTYANESVKIGDFVGLSEFEFCIYDGLIESAPKFYLKGLLNLLILSNNQFMIEGEDEAVIYQITGEKDFSFLFANVNE